MTSWSQLQLDARVCEEAGKLLLVPKRAPDRSVRSQAPKFIPGVQSAVRFDRKGEQVIHVFSPVRNKRETMSQTLAPCSSIALPSPRPE